MNASHNKHYFQPKYLKVLSSWICDLGDSKQPIIGRSTGPGCRLAVVSSLE